MAPQATSETVKAGLMLSVCTMYGGKLTLYLAMSAKLAKIHGRPGWRGGLDGGGRKKTVPGRNTMRSVPPEAFGRSMRMVDDGPVKSTAPWASRGSCEAVEADDRWKVMAKSAVWAVVRAVAWATAARACGEAGNVDAGLVEVGAADPGDPQADRAVLARRSAPRRPAPRHRGLARGRIRPHSSGAPGPHRGHRRDSQCRRAGPAVR